MREILEDKKKIQNSLLSEAKETGYTSGINDGISKGVSNLELNAAYATIANGGTYTKPRFYTKILDREGNVIIDNTPQTHTVLKATTAWLLTSAMKDVITQGTGKNADIPGMTVAAKTGTTNDSRDSLFAGFSPYYSCVIWGGYDDNAPMASTSYTKLLWKTIRPFRRNRL